MLRQGLFLSGFLFLWLCCQAAEPLRFNHISIDEGLSHSIVNTIYQDSTGFMWFGTGNGLNRYDGYTIRRFLEVKDQPEKIAVVTIFEAFGSLWVASELNLLRFDASREQLRTCRSKALDEVLARAKIQSVFVSGQLIVLATFAEIVTIDPVSYSVRQIVSPSDKQRLLGSVIKIIQPKPSGALLIACSKGIVSVYNQTITPFTPTYTIPGTSTEMKFLLPSKNGELWAVGDFVARVDVDHRRYHPDSGSTFVNSQNRIYHMNAAALDHQNNLWMGATDLGLICYRPFKGVVAKYTSTDRQSGGIMSNNVMSIAIDRSDNLWVATFKNGLNKADLHQKMFRTMELDGTINNNIYGLGYNPSTGQLMAGNASSSVLFVNPATLQIEQTLDLRDVFSDIRVIPEIIGGILYDQSGSFWIAPYVGGMLHYTPGKPLVRYLAQPINGARYSPAWSYHVLLKDSEGIIWIGTSDQNLLWYNAKEDAFAGVKFTGTATINPSDHNIWSIYEDRAGTIWVGTEVSGLLRGTKVAGSPGTLQVAQYLMNSNSKTSLTSNSVRALYEDADGNMWIGTAGGGLNVLFSNDRGVKAYTVSDGLPNNVVYGIYPDKIENLWLFTERGLSYFDRRTEKFVNFFKNDGLLADEFNPNANLRAPDGTIWAGNHRGIVAFHPDSIFNNPIPPTPQITNLYINNLPASGGYSSETQLFQGQLTKLEKLVLRYRFNSFAFEFSAMHYANPANCKYIYKLENFDDTWQETDATRRYVSYTKVPYGKYTLRYNATNNDQVWGTERQLEIIVKPPFWKSIPAKITYLLLLIGLLFLFRHFIMFREQMMSRLRIERIKLEKEREIDTIKTRFFTNISHEFRTPLTLIISPLEKLLTSSGLPAPIRQELIVMQRNANRLLRLVNQWLDFRKLETGNMKLNLSTGDLFEFIPTVQSAFSATAAERNIALTFDAFQPSFIYQFDLDKMEKIFYNLLSNAFKYTPNGGAISVRAAMTEADADKTLVIEVSDTGSGIPAQSLPFIFERFYQVDAKDLDKKPGTGIGLSLCRELIELHGGFIAASSDMEKGTRIIISLPFAGMETNQPDTVPEKAVASDDSSDENTPAPSAGKKYTETLLLVEDNPELRDYIFKDLSQQYTVYTAVNGEQGLSMALSEIPDLIVSDVMMPIMDGLALTRALKSDQRTSHIPVILLTARSADEHRLEGFETGADDYVSKPFNMAMLTTRIRNLLETRKRLSEIFIRHLNLQEGLSEASIHDREFMQRAMMIIEENLLNSGFTNDHFIEQMGMSKPTLYKKLKSLTNQSVSDFIRTIRLNKAARLMLTTQLKISEIAYQVGYSDPSNFSRYFTQLYGMPPKEYMAKYRGGEISSA